MNEGVDIIGAESSACERAQLAVDIAALVVSLATLATVLWRRR